MGLKGLIRHRLAPGRLVSEVALKGLPSLKVDLVWGDSWRIIGDILGVRGVMVSTM